MGAGNYELSEPLYAESFYDGQATLAPPNDESEADMFFQNYGVNPFIDTEDDHLSTFSTDVDTGSYTITRRYLNQGDLPPTDAIRVEEFVNYFPQNYPTPSKSDTFGIQIDGAETPFGETERYQMIRIGIQGYDLDFSERKDASLTLVIDVSGSMDQGNRLELVKDSIELLIDQLRPTDKIAIIAYTDTAWVVLPSTYVENKEMIKEELNKLRPMDSTNAEAGLRLGYEEALKGFMPGGINRVILCSDGVANVGNTGAGSIWETIKYQASEGITLTSVGFGMGNYNDVLLEQLADNGDGFYAYVDTIDEAERLFVYDLVSTLQVIALDTKVQVDFNAEVVSRYRLVGFENRAIADEDFRDDSVDAAEIGAGHNVTALYEVKLFPEAEGEIFTVYLRWEDPDDHQVHETEEVFSTDELGESFSSADPYFQLDVIVAEFAEILRNSYWAEGSTLENLLEYAKNVSNLIEHQKVFELVDLIELAISNSDPNSE